MYHVFEQACVNITTTLPIGNVLQKPRNSGKKTAPFVYPKEKQDATHARTLEIVYFTMARERFLVLLSLCW